MSQSHASSTGQRFTDTGYLDAHFEANRVEYEELVRMAGLQPGWHVLDAGCGGGNFLPWIADIVGSEGAITALDLAPENVKLAEQRVRDWNLPCSVDAIAGSVLALPFPDGYVDGVWCANTSQYLTDDELDAMLAEFRRVTRPGGLVAIKDVEGWLVRFEPIPEPYRWHYLEARGFDDAQIHGTTRTWNMQRFLERAGFTAVRQDTMLIEHRAPLSPPARELWTSFVTYLATNATRHGAEWRLPAEEMEFWRAIIDDTPDSVLHHPDFYATEGQVLAVGRVPGVGESRS